AFTLVSRVTPADAAVAISSASMLQIGLYFRRYRRRTFQTSRQDAIKWMPSCANTSMRISATDLQSYQMARRLMYLRQRSRVAGGSMAVHSSILESDSGVILR